MHSSGMQDVPKFITTREQKNSGGGHRTGGGLRPARGYRTICLFTKSRHDIGCPRAKISIYFSFTFLSFARRDIFLRYALIKCPPSWDDCRLIDVSRDSPRNMFAILPK